MSSLTVHAQDGSSMAEMKMSGMGDMQASASTQAFKRADEKMMKEMSAPPYTGDADRDFVAHMIPHHQGAIDMAEIELKYGKDPGLKRLAKSIVAAQHNEIEYMRKWEAQHGQDK
jgi:uncharacterized protein (DUF305 family)